MNTLGMIRIIHCMFRMLSEWTRQLHNSYFAFCLSITYMVHFGVGGFLVF